MRAALLITMMLLVVGVWAGNPITQALPNGLRVITQPTTSAQVVSISLLVDFSALDEPVDYSGLRQVLMTSMLCGSQEMDGTVIRRKLASVGGILEGRVHQDALEFTVRIPAGSTGVALRALGDIICHPKLTDDDIAASITQTQGQLDEEPIGALGYTERLAASYMYYNHPYATGGPGTSSGLARLTAPIVRWAYQTYVVPRATVMAMVGRCKTEDVMPIVRQLFESWTPKPKPTRAVWERPLLRQTGTIVHEEPVRNTCVMLAFPVCGSDDPDFLTLRVVESLLSGGTGARLFRSVREKLHLAYEVATLFPSQVDCSHFAIYALTSTQHMEETRAALTDELVRLQTQPVPASELQRAKAYLKGRYLMGHQFSSQYAFDLAWYELQGLGTQYDATFTASIDAVTPADIQRVARAYFTNYILAVVMPLSIKNDNKQGRGLSSLPFRVSNTWLGDAQYLRGWMAKAPGNYRYYKGEQETPDQPVAMHQ